MRNRVGEILEHQGRSVTWLARKTGRDRAFLSRVLNDRVEPSAETRQLLAEALDLPVDILFFGVECPTDLSDNQG